MADQLDRKQVVEEFCIKDLINELTAHSPTLGDWAKNFTEEHGNDFSVLINTLFNANRAAQIISNQYDMLMDTRKR